jgi:hypothetical protein
MAQDLFVLLGASGEIGHRVAVRLGERRASVLLVGRSRDRLQGVADGLPDAALAHEMDVATDDMSTLLAELQRISPVVGRVIIIDAVVDKASARAMRRSLLGVARVVEELVAWSRRRPHGVLVLSANSIAAHAHWPYHTSYGRLKRRQALAYKALGVPVAVVYLPFLFDYNHGPSGTSLADQLLWPYFDFGVRACTYDLAADVLSALATSDPLRSGGAIDVELQTGSHSLLQLRGLTPNRPGRLVAVLAAVPVALLGRSLLRSSPAWQRRAAYACLFMTPGRLRKDRDHHRPLEVEERLPWSSG